MEFAVISCVAAMQNGCGLPISFRRLRKQENHQEGTSSRRGPSPINPSCTTFPSAPGLLTAVFPTFKAYCPCEFVCLPGLILAQARAC